MSKARIIAVGVVLLAVSALLQREFGRGSFDAVERAFVGWLAANVNAGRLLPPLAVVLYDEEASSVAGSERMGALDVALFARAAARAGALAAGVENLPGDPARMIEAAGGMPLFGGYDLDKAPATGWTPWAGTPDSGWQELPGLVGPASTRFPRGFFTAPDGASGPRSVLLAARNADRAVPSFLALAWAASLRSRVEPPTAGSGWLYCEKRKLPLDSRGRANFFPAAQGVVMGMNELLVAAEKFEREGGRPPLGGHIVVLARATPEVVRFKDSSTALAATPVELWAQTWHALRLGRLFLLPGAWYAAVLAIAAFSLCFWAKPRSWLGLIGTAAAVFFIYLLAALASFASQGLLLPFVPSVGTLFAGLVLGRFLPRS